MERVDLGGIMLWRMWFLFSEADMMSLMEARFRRSVNEGKRLHEHSVERVTPQISRWHRRCSLLSSSLRFAGSFPKTGDAYSRIDRMTPK